MALTGDAARVAKLAQSLGASKEKAEGAVKTVLSKPTKPSSGGSSNKTQPGAGVPANTDSDVQWLASQGFLTDNSAAGVQKAISVANLAQQAPTPIVVPQPPQLPVNNFPGLLASTGKFDAQGMPIIQTPTDSQPDATQDLGKMLQGYMGEAPQRIDRQEIERQAGVTQLGQATRDLEAQINAIQADTNAAIMQVRNQSSIEGGTIGILSAREDALQRSAAIKLLPLTAQYQAAIGNLNAAKEQVNAYIADENAYQDRLYTYKKDLGNKVWDYMTTQQQRQWQLQDQANADDTASTKALNNAKNSWAQMAIDSGQSSLLKGILGAKTEEELNNYVSQLRGGTSGGGSAEIDRVIDINGVQTPVDKYGNVINIKGGTQTTPTTNSTAQLDLMTKTLENVFGATYDSKTGEFTPTKDKDALYKVSGQSPITRTITSWGGVTQFQQLQNYANTLRTNMLTLATDPSIKKFFGPQMSNADVKLMMSGGTTLDPESQTPEQFKEEALRVADFIARANKAVTTGIQKETSMKSVEQPQTMTVGSVTYKLGSDGLYYTQ
jgi:hypothetical protein